LLTFFVLKRSVLYPDIVAWKRERHWAKLFIGVSFVFVKHIVVETKEKMFGSSCIIRTAVAAKLDMTGSE
jgi:hypothetical protein